MPSPKENLETLREEKHVQFLFVARFEGGEDVEIEIGHLGSASVIEKLLDLHDELVKMGYIRS